MQITEAHLDEAIRMTKAGGGMGHKYNQRSWCGTACGVLGFARLVAGLPERNQGPQPGEIVDTPKGRLIEGLMTSPDSAVLELMEHIQSDGTLDRPVHIDGNLYLGGCTKLTTLPDNLTVGASLDLEGCTALTHLPDGLTVGGYLYLGGCTSLTHLPAGLTVGGRLYLSGCTALPDEKIPEHLRSKVVR